MISLRSLRAVLLVLTVFALPGADDRFAGLSKAVTEFRLANGAQFFVVERPNSPLVAFHLRVKAGFADEPTGQSGVALLALTNFIEGSELYGSKNPTQEKASLAEAIKLLEVSRAEESKGEQADEIKKGRADYQARAAFDQAASFAVAPRFYDQVLSNSGVSGFEWRTSADYSDLAFALPSHRAELWFRSVGSWLQAPSSRFFFAGQAFVLDQRAQSAKTGSTQRERAFTAAFTVHPYRSIAAPENEIAGLGAAEVRSFLKSFYVPSNLTVAIVGDIAPAEARRMAEFYFGKLPAAVAPEARGATILKVEGVQPVRLALPEAPLFSAGWPRPASGGADDAVFELLQAVLGGGPGSVLYNELMVDAQIARRMTVFSRYPGGRFPGLFVIEAEPQANRSHEEVELGIVRGLESIKKRGATDEELERARAWWRKRFLAEAGSAAGRARQLVQSQTEFGTFRMEERLAKLDAVTSKDCQRVVAEYLADKAFLSVLQLSAVPGEGQ